MSDFDDIQAPERLPVGVAGFDLISHGGLVKGRTTLVVGTSGSGKTLLAVEALYRSITEFGRSGVFVTFEESPRDIVRNVKRLDWDLAGLCDQGKLAIIDASMDRQLIAEAGLFDLSGLIAQVDHAVKEIGAEFVVLDSLGSLFFSYGSPAVLRRELLRLNDMLRGMGVTSMMTAERLDETGRVSRFGIEEFVSDCVIILRHHLIDEKVRRTIQVYKLRGDTHFKDEFPFTIQYGGLSIMPLPAAELSQQSTPKRISFGNTEVDELAGGGLFHDSVILISGPTGSGKSLMGATFAAEGCRRGDRVLMLGYEESRPQMVRNALAWGIDFPSWERKGALKLICKYPETQSLERHLYNIRKEIDEYQPTRIILDSVSALERVGPQRTFREFVIGLTGLVKEKQICGLFTSTSSHLSGGDSITDAHISTITDAIILLRYVDVAGTLSRGLTIIKMRGSQHDKRFHEFAIDDGGMHVIGPLESGDVSLLGLPSASRRANGEP